MDGLITCLQRDLIEHQDRKIRDARVKYVLSGPFSAGTQFA